MKLNVDETSLGDSNAPVWQQLLPSSAALGGATGAQSTERAVRIDIPSAATPTDSETTTRQTRSSTSSWLNFATSWTTRDRTSSGPVNGIYRQAINSTDSTADDVLLQSNSGVEEKVQPSASSPLMK